MHSTPTIHPHRQPQIFTAALLLVAALLLSCTPVAPVAEAKLRVEDAWSRPALLSSEGVSMGAAYLTLINEGGEGDRLVAAQSDVATEVELHQSKVEGDVMKMSPVSGGVKIPAGGEVMFKPGGYHIMLIGLQRDLNAGDRFSLRLEFDRSDPLMVEVEVRLP